MVATREVTYASDGLTMVGHLACPEGEGPWPTVSAGPGATGNALHRGRADVLPALGAGPDGRRRYAVARIAAEFGVTRPTIDRPVSQGHGYGRPDVVLRTRVLRTR